MIRDLIQTQFSLAVARLQAAGALPADLSAPIEVVDPRDPSHGDFACNYALVASKQAGMNPRELAEKLKDELLTSSFGGGGRGVDDRSPQNSSEGTEVWGGSSSTPQPPPSMEGEYASGLFKEIEIAGPGFLNIRVTDEAWMDSVAWANERGVSLPKPQRPAPGVQRINIEFVSVNPNGPITVGSGRGAAFGSTLANVMETVGHEVHREYYINDGTNSEQMRLFAKAVNNKAWMLKTRMPEFTLELARLDHWVKAHFFRLASYIGNRGLTFDDAWFEEQIPNYLLSNQAIDDGTLPLLEGGFANLDDFVDWLHMSYRSWLVDPDFLDRLYKGDYINALASELMAEHFGALRQPLEWWKAQSEEKMIVRQMDDLRDFSTTFDTWFSEQSLHDSGIVDHSIAHLIANGAADEEPVRRKLKLAKGGKIEDVEVEVQPREDEEGTEGPGDQGTNDGQSSIVNQHSPLHSTLWLRSTKFGDDMDRVLRRKDGRLTYIASDVAYHKDKFNRPANADKLITILGPDHHGYISRLHAVLAALELEGNDERRTTNDDPDEYSEIDAKIYTSKEEKAACRAALEKARNELEVIIFQIVRFVKEGKPSPMRKRDGNIYSLRDLMVEIGKDAAPNATPEEQMVTGKDVARFFYLMRSHDTHMDFDIDLATKGTDENPVFYVQYAHARICSILRKAEEIDDLRLTIDDSPKQAKDSASLSPTAVPQLSIVNQQSSIKELHPKESALIKKVLDLPWEVQRCAEDYGVHRLTTYAIELARTFHHFYDACRVIQPEEPELTQRRLAICEATRHALRGTLAILGVSAPMEMSRAEKDVEPGHIS